MIGSINLKKKFTTIIIYMTYKRLKVVLETSSSDTE